MINLTIEGRTVSVPEGTSILEAARLAGILIPHYCYHPGLPVAGSCRMCLVEVEKMPKLAPSCATAVGEGQVVHVYSEKALESRKSVLEFLLINHPLDCPICDRSGECELQDYTFQEGPAESRLHDPKRFNPVEDFGGDILYVTNRCILCTRCVRFMDDVHQEPVLNVSERGDRAVIGKASDHDLTQAWAGNIVDLCPVGALVSKDFLNKARAWELDRTASVCTGCSQGCNNVIETRDNMVVRTKPRPNEDVNHYYLCDEGRLGYRWMNRADRLELPKVRMHDVLSPVDWEIALAEAAKVLKDKRAYVVASPGLPNEALFLLKQLVTASKGDGAFRCATGPEAPLPGVPDLSLRADRAPNVMGAELLGFRRRDDDLFSGLRDGDVLIVADEELKGLDIGAARKASAIIVIGTVLPAGLPTPAVVLPIANVAEGEGTFTNLRGRVQRFLQAKAAPGLARPAWFALADLNTALGLTSASSAFLPADVFAAMAAAEPAFAGMSYDTLGLRGAIVAGMTAGAA
ncbi:MAG TPA: 2Fe-2S iron-sulfur cluster-binding protein [Gemmatimonadaceae bacterium]|nr:2Fe-2S iron-sulfur cluster-binding protein [Gemmatimonadaceae bacterium]